MLPKTDVEKLLEMYRDTNRQTDELLEIIKDIQGLIFQINNINDSNIKSIHRQQDFLLMLFEEINKSNSRILELEKEVRELKNANNLWTWSRN